MKTTLGPSIMMLIHKFPDWAFWLQDYNKIVWAFLFIYPPLIWQPKKFSKKSENLARLFCINLITNLRCRWLTLKLDSGKGKNTNIAAICTDFLKLMKSKSRTKIVRCYCLRSRTSRVGFMICVCLLYSSTSHSSLLCSVASPKIEKHTGELKI